MSNNIFEDEELINQLVENYASLIRGICRRFYLVGGTSDDLYQEGMIGLLEAAKQFDESRGTIGDDSFKKFATTCIKRQILDAIKHANDYKTGSGIAIMEHCTIYGKNSFAMSIQKSAIVDKFIEFYNSLV